MHKILKVRNANRPGPYALTSRPMKFMGIASIVALLFLAATQWTPRNSNLAYAPAPRSAPEVQSTAAANIYVPVRLPDPAPGSASEEHIQAF